MNQHFAKKILCFSALRFDRVFLRFPPTKVVANSSEELARD